MKKIVIFSFICLVAFITGSCKKEDENQGASKNSHRIKERFIRSSNSDTKTVYTYAGEKISQSLIYTGYKSSQENWAESAKNEYVYENNKVTQTRLTYSAGTWTPSYQYVKLFSGSKLTEQQSNKFENNAWVPQYKFAYLYSGNKLVKEEYYYTDGNGGLTLEEKWEYTYTDNRCTEFLFYASYTSGNLELLNKVTLSYTSGNLSEMIWHSEYDGNWRKVSKEVFTYSENRLANIKSYNWNEYNGTWDMEAVWSESYEYDANGYLTRELITDYTYGYTYEYEYTYEAGNGNGQMLLNSPGNEIFGYPVIRKAVSGLPSDLINSTPE
jgi:hypothetical protein